MLEGHISEHTEKKSAARTGNKHQPPVCMQPVRPPPPTHNFPREGAHEGGGGRALALRPFSPPRGALFVHKFFRNEKFQFPPSSVTVFVTPRKNGREGACEARKGSTRRTKKNPYTHIFYQYIFPGASVRLYFFGPFFRSAFYPHIDIEGARCDMSRERDSPTLTVTTSQDVKLDQTFYPPKRAPAT